MYPADSNFIKEVYHEIWFRRNIMGRIRFNKDRNVLESVLSGCFYSDVYGPNTWAGIGNSTDRLKDIPYNIIFDASKVVPTASDNHPYSMYFVPLITY